MKLLHDVPYKWYTGYDRCNRELPIDCAKLLAALLKGFSQTFARRRRVSNDVHLTGGSICKRICEPVETLLDLMDRYEEGPIPNKFIWGLHPELERPVSLQDLRAIDQNVSLRKSTELAFKMQRRPRG